MAHFKELILVIEDDVRIAKFMKHVVEQENFNCLVANDAKNGLEIFVSNQVSLLILDLGLPDYDGIEVIKKIREWSNVPIIVVSARDSDDDKVEALDCGADDYLTKPFSSKELLARIRVSLRHYNRQLIDDHPIIQVRGLSMDLSKHVVTSNGQEIHLTPLEYKLLSLLLKNTGKVLTTKYIISKIYGVSYGEDTQALRTLMTGLRRKIEQDPTNPQYIITEIGVGYRLKE